MFIKTPHALTLAMDKAVLLFYIGEHVINQCVMCCSYYVYMKKREANLGIRFYRHRYWLISEVVNSAISGSKMYSMKPILKMKTLSY